MVIPYMKKFLLHSLVTVFTALVWAPFANAEPIGVVVEPQPQLLSSSLVITAYYADKGDLQFVQLHNASDSVVALDEWSLELSAYNATDEIDVQVAELSGWFAPRGHIVVAKAGVVTGADITYELDPSTETLLREMQSVHVRVIPPEDQLLAPVEQQLAQFAPQWAQRNISSATGNYLSTFSTKTTFAELVGGGLYYPTEDTAGLRIVEVLANAKTCSPTDTALDCNDYIKIHNPTEFPVDLSLFRLRSDSGGQKPTASNTIELTGSLEAGTYTTIGMRSIDDVLSLTNSGGYVWFEDKYGVASFEPMVFYADASATTKKGLSWALDDLSGEWKWMQPAPNTTNYWPPEVVPVISTDTNVLDDCGPGRERNPATNRCRSIVSATTTLQPCAPGQERNPETNRCRSVASTMTTLVPCGPGQERNPETNRCRSVLSATTTLQPCAPGQERNPETNRCRKIPVASTAAASLPTIQDVESPQIGSKASWYVTGALVFAAVGYGMYEWRHELRERIRWPWAGRK